MTNQYAEHEYVARVGEQHPALIIVGEDYSRGSAPTQDEVRDVLQKVSEWDLSSVYEIREGPVEVQHESPPTDPYEAWGVVVAFEQSPTVNEYDWDGSVLDAQRLLYDHLDNIEIWVDAV